MQAATVVINRRALRHNLQRLRELAPASKMVAVVKANAYGHGLLETARTLPDADAFGVARLEEALRLRAGGITKPVLLLEGFFDARDLPTISAQHFHTAVHNEEQLAALEEASLDEPVTVWMKLDTGMHRLGVRVLPPKRCTVRCWKIYLPRGSGWLSAQPTVPEIFRTTFLLSMKHCRNRSPIFLRSALAQSVLVVVNMTPFVGLLINSRLNSKIPVQNRRAKH